MKAFQLHYTSCRRGRSGSPGFQVRAASPGIRPDEQREIERRGVYRPPRTAPAEPTLEQVARDFPRAFRFYRLESGRRALTFSCYTGKDYSGRWGNFFAHTLVFDGEPRDGAEGPALWPIDYYEWEGWYHADDPRDSDRHRSEEEPAGEEPAAPPVLGPVDLGDASPAESFQLSELQGFLTEDPERPELLVRMGRAVLLGRESSRPLVLRADALDGAFWVACILKLFPPRHAWELTFSTYQDDPRGTAAINATVPGTDFAFSEAERSYQFYMFDPATGIFSDVPSHDGDYPTLATRWLAEEPETLEGFFDFLQRFDPFPLDADELLAAAHLFRAGRGEVAGIDGRRLAQLLDFADRRASAEGRVALMTEVGEVLLRSADPGELAGDGGALRFLAQVADATGQPSHRKLAFDVWLRWLESTLASGGTRLEALDRGWRDLREILRDYQTGLALAFLDPEQLRRFAVHDQALGSEPLAWLLGLVRECLVIAGRNPFWEQPEMRERLAALLATGDVEAVAELALRQTRGDGKALAGLSIEILHAAGDSSETARTVGRALGKVLRAEPASLAHATRRHLEAGEKWAVLWGEWLFLVATADDPAAAFTAYDREVLDVLPRYRDRARTQAAKSVLEFLEGTRAAAQAARWVASSEIDSFSRDLQEHCVTLANRQVSFDLDDPGAERLAARVEETARRARLRLQPNHPWLRRLLSKTREAGTTPPGVRSEDLKTALEGIGADSYRSFLEGFLLPFLEGAGNYKQHGLRLLAVDREPLRDVLAEVYVGFFQVQRAIRQLGPLQAGVKFWLLFDTAKEQFSLLAPLERMVLPAVAEGLRRLPAKSFRELKRRLDRTKLSGPALRRWQEMEEQVLARRKGFFRRVLGGWSRGSGDRDRTL